MPRRPALGLLLILALLGCQADLTTPDPRPNERGIAGVAATDPTAGSVVCPACTFEPRLYTRSFHTDETDYDKERVGWRITELTVPPGEKLPAIERRRIYDTSKPGRSNAGHTYGDALTDEERTALVEYLKTL